MKSSEGDAEIALCGAQFVGKHVGADDRQAGAHAGSGRRAPGRVAEEAHAPTGVRVQMNLAQRVEIGLSGDGKGAQNSGSFPAEAGESFREQLLVAFDVSVIELEVVIGEPE